MGRSERSKGTSGELEVRDVFRAAGFDCDRTPNSGALRIRSDLYGSVPAHVEVKRQETARPWLWWEQATSSAEAGVMALVAFRRSRSRWLAIVDLEQLAQLMAAAERQLMAAAELARVNPALEVSDEQRREIGDAAANGAYEGQEGPVF